jgi:hypothetical protein
LKPIRIITADDERIRIPFEIPIKGRKPLQFTVPRLDYIDEEEFIALTKDIEALDEDESFDNMRKKTRAIALVMLKRFLTEQQMAILEKVAFGCLNQILETWQEKSAMNLGEFLASADSSTESTGRPSKPISSPKDGAEPTLATA